MKHLGGHKSNKHARQHWQCLHSTCRHDEVSNSRLSVSGHYLDNPDHNSLGCPPLTLSFTLQTGTNPTSWLQGCIQGPLDVGMLGSSHPLSLTGKLMSSTSLITLVNRCSPAILLQLLFLLLVAFATGKVQMRSGSLTIKQKIKMRMCSGKLQIYSAKCSCEQDKQTLEAQPAMEVGSRSSLPTLPQD